MPRSHNKQKLKEFLESTSNEQVESTIEEFEKMLDSSSVDEKIMIDSEITSSLPAVIEPGSIDEYIYGCLSDVSESGNSCTPSCSNGYRSGDLTECSLSICEKKEGVIKQLNNKKSSRAFLYVQQGDKFSSKDIKKLTKLNSSLEEVFVYTQDKDSRTYSHSHTHIVKTVPKKQKSSPVGMYYVILLVLFLVILFVIVYFVYTKLYLQPKNMNFSVLENK